ncbi:TPM domain-containing protein [Janthinobacterium sp.]|uniref:TPM domain-containing protein n=1 Tax=Janthinobacterium sp. TaxID=1871054 RepID=UPI0028A1EEDA|nr:TPM domain-containing protein [Janthinobacterium sp.]
MMNRAAACFLRASRWLCMLFLLQSTPAYATLSVPALQSHVNDYAGVLAARGPAIDATLKAFETQTGHQVFVLTVAHLPADTSIEAYAVAVFEQWQPGRKDKDDGALLVIATGDKKMRIETGYGLEDRLTDLASARIVREVITPRFRQGDTEGGVAAGVDAMLAVISGQPAAAPLASAGTQDREISGAAKWIVLGLFGVLLLFGLCMSLFAGVFGLLASVIVTVSVVLLFASDWRGWIGAGAVILAWLLLRWRMVANNVRKYHLPKARSKTLAWLKVYLFSLGFARGGPARKRERDDSRSSGSSGSSGSSSSGGGGTTGGGGRSGGGGASGSW